MVGATPHIGLGLILPCGVAGEVAPVMCAPWRAHCPLDWLSLGEAEASRSIAITHIRLNLNYFYSYFHAHR